MTPLILVSLLACARPEPVETARFRADSAPIYSSAVLLDDRLAGHWDQVATFARNGQPACSPGNADIQGGQVRWTLCLADGEQSGASLMQPVKPGRYAVSGMEPWWVLWADADYRTLVIGTPSGRFGFVLNRGSALSADRQQAVRDILQFNGFRLQDLVIF